MKTAWVVLLATLLVLLVCGLFWLAARPGREGGSATAPDQAASAPAGPAFRLGLVPERDIFAQRNRYRALADYLQKQLGRPIELVEVNTYDAVLLDFQEKTVEGAFLGSMVATLAMDRLGAKVLVKPEYPNGVSTYRGVVFVPADSPITSVDQLAGRSIAMVKTTTAGNLFPVFLLVRHGLLEGPRSPKIVWVGTHDDVAQEVMAGRADAGAIKDDRLEAMLAQNPQWRIRRLATGEPVPNNGLVLRADVAEGLGDRLSHLLLTMDADPKGREALSAFGAKRFIPCRPEEYGAIYDMVERLGSAWDRVGVEGPPPRRLGLERGSPPPTPTSSSGPSR